MSTRFYPLYRRGNPQLRIFLPNFFMKLVRNKIDQPPNVVSFVVPLEMTQFDVKNYLEKIYNVPVAQVSTKVVLGKIKPQEYKRYLIKEDDYRLATVTLPEGCFFQFPNMFPQDRQARDAEDMRKNKLQIEEHERSFKRVDPHRQNLPDWFSA
ncbi:39S ribosomal protein L23 [Tropilaelaps mercedesae]|uniref:Large ribosomal subunit protein uL23m n=1 Tax=Tropilaelaps mercedesae TaxID=418985 RepID=A0A1V9XCV8_9ACAR|nr:39S ribosomal protein L23 [Tropilaelaps mercedesae]